MTIGEFLPIKFDTVICFLFSFISSFIFSLIFKGVCFYSTQFFFVDFELLGRGAFSVNLIQ